MRVLLVTTYIRPTVSPRRALRRAIAFAGLPHSTRLVMSDLAERGLDHEQGTLFVIDGAKALRKAIRST